MCGGGRVNGTELQRELSRADGQGEARLKQCSIRISRVGSRGQALAVLFQAPRQEAESEVGEQDPGSHVGMQV